MWITNFAVYRGLVVLFCSILVITQAQENIQRRVPDSLLECYINPELLDRDNRLPTTLTTLIDLIRKVENYEQSRLSLRELTVELLYRFRVDGLKKAENVLPSSDLIPYSTTGEQFEKHVLLFSRLLPKSTKPFPNDTLTAVERCSLHFMLSSSIETEVRGDEGSRCGQLSEYRSLRIPRKAERAQNMREEYEDFGNNNQISQCPVETGVIRTKWGAVSAGTLLAGIAAGLENQKVSVRNLISFSTNLNARKNDGSNPIYASEINSLYPATLVGDLAEAALFQGHEDNIQVGSRGAWNSTSVPRWYFLNSQKPSQITDAEIRGGLDGLIIGSNIKAWSSSASTLKLSQVLDMYYSERGVFSGEEKACKRQELFVKYAPSNTLKTQAASFTTVLEKEINLKVSLSQERIQEAAQKAADRLIAYVPTLNDLKCGATNPATGGEIRNIGNAVELLVVLDTTWQYHDIVQILSLIIEGIEARPYGSSVKVMNAKDLSIIVNTTNYAADFHGQFNLTAYQRHPMGFDIQRILTNLHPVLYDSMEYEHNAKIAGGRSQVILLIAASASLSEADVNFSEEHMRRINEESPDLRFLVLAPSSLDRFNTLVRDPAKDLFTISVSGSIQNPPSVIPILDRIQKIPRRVINHNCNAKWEQGDNQGNIQLEDDVDPDGINFYRIHPSYFFGNADRKIRVQGQGYGTLNVCYSRQIENPVASAIPNSNESNDVTCRLITSDTVEIELNSPCEDSYYIVDCSPLYISVSASTNSTAGSYRCLSRDCRTPDQLRFTINAENLGCYSGVSALIGSFSLILVLLATIATLFL
uniref:VWFA domain-containing protein n=1 Tax=Xenopsylla cheopis TaxID=163159 RepID=A0A6M2DZA1_XENCH